MVVTYLFFVWGGCDVRGDGGSGECGVWKGECGKGRGEGKGGREKGGFFSLLFFLPFFGCQGLGGRR